MSQETTYSMILERQERTTVRAPAPPKPSYLEVERQLQEVEQQIQSLQRRKGSLLRMMAQK